MVKSAERTIRLLEWIAASAPKGLTFGELQQRSGYPRSSLHGLLRTLLALKWVDTDESESIYRLGTNALLCGTTYLDSDKAAPFVVRTLEDLRAATGYTTHFARLDESHVIYLATRDAPQFPGMFSRVGRRLPAHVTALGQALLAGFTQDEVDRVLPKKLEAFTKNTIVRRGELHAELERVRERGYACEREQGTVGIACVAGAVEYRIPATDAVSVALPAQKATERELRRLGELVRRHTVQLGALLRRKGIR